MRKHEPPPRGLDRHAVRLGVGRCGQQEIPGRAGVGLRHPPLVERRDPVGQGIPIPLAGGEPSAHRIPEDLLLGAAHRKNCPAVLVGDRQGPAGRGGRRHPVVQLGPAEPERRGAGPGRADQGRIIVVHPRQVPRYPGAPRETAREKARVPRRGLGDSVVLVRIGEECSAGRKALEPAGELLLPAVQIVPPHLVHRNHHDQVGLVGGPGRQGPGLECRRGAKDRGSQKWNEKSHGRHGLETRNRTKRITPKGALALPGSSEYHRRPAFSRSLRCIACCA